MGEGLVRRISPDVSELPLEKRHQSDATWRPIQRVSWAARIHVLPSPGAPYRFSTRKGVATFISTGRLFDASSFFDSAPSTPLYEYNQIAYRIGFPATIPQTVATFDVLAADG